MQKLNCPHCEIGIDEHEASRCLDGWIAEKVMGGIETMNFQEVSECYWRFETPAGKVMLVDSKIRGLPLWSPSASIKAAWEVVEKIEKQLGIFRIMRYAYEGRTNFWKFEGPSKAKAQAKTAPLAICRAAIKAANES